jgi:hypothetical protein
MVDGSWLMVDGSWFMVHGEEASGVNKKPKPYLMISAVFMSNCVNPLVNMLQPL